MTASLPQPNHQSGALDMLRRAVGPTPAERALGAATARPTPAERALGALAGKPTAAEKTLGQLAGKPTLAEKFLGAEKPGGLTFEEKILGVTKPGGPTFTEKMLGISKRGGKSPMEKLASRITPPTLDTSLTGMLDRLSGPAVETAFPQLDRSATSLFKTDPSEFTYVPNIDRPTDEQDLDADLDWEEIEESEELAVIVPDAEIVEVVDHRYSAATDAIDDGREWLSRVCPSALTAVDGASFAFDQHGPDHEAHVALGCRRTFEFLADILCPAVSEKKPDRKGKMRELGPDNYVNRILRYLDQAKADDGQYELVSKDMAFLSSTFDHLIERCQKGVHERASARETRRIMLLTWSVLSELAQVATR